MKKDIWGDNYYHPIDYTCSNDEYREYLMNTEEKPKEKKRHTKFKKDDKPTNWGEVVSIYGNVYPDSKESDWQGYEGLGWLHAKERDMFRSDYVQCCVSEQWNRPSFMSRTGHNMFVNNREIKKGDWFICEKDTLAYPIEEMEKVYTDGEREIKMSRISRDKYCFQCDLDKRYYWGASNLKIRVAESEKYKVISSVSLRKSKKFHFCANCNKAFEAEMNKVLMREEFATTMCETCFEVALAKDVIKAHNYTHYPRPIFTAPPKPRVTKEALDRLYKVMNEFDHPMKENTWDDILRQGVMLYGLECETEFKNPKEYPGKRAKLAFQALKALGKDFVIIKHDGSLSGTREPEVGEKIRRGGEYGFEIVTAPCDIATHRERWKRLEQMQDYEQLRAWDVGTCGLHIHVSRAPMTALQVARISYMVNHPDMKDFIQLVAGRSAARYNKFIPKKNLSDGIRPEMDKDKYTAINIKHQHTIEFRIFRGTVNYRHIIRNLEFVQAVVQYCGPGERSIRDLRSYACFVEFVANRRKEWPELNRWLRTDIIVDHIDLPKKVKDMLRSSERDFGPKDERTKKGEKKIGIDEVTSPSSDDTKTVKAPRASKTTVTPGKKAQAGLVFSTFVEPDEDEF